MEDDFDFDLPERSRVGVHLSPSVPDNGARWLDELRGRVPTRAGCNNCHRFFGQITGGFCGGGDDWVWVAGHDWCPNWVIREGALIVYGLSDETEKASSEEDA